MKAIILAAGQGLRLKPETDNLPKCLVRVKNVPILQYQLESLEGLGITTCIIVKGFKGELIRDAYGRKFGNLKLDYVTNDYFMETNNIYSLWCAKEYLADDIILIEGDVLFDKHILEDIINGADRNCAVIDDFRSGMDGTVVLEEDNCVRSMILKSRQTADFDYSKAFKTVNIYSFDRATMQDYLIPTLDSWVNEGFTNEFYEATIAYLIEQGAFRLGTQHVGTRRWAEIDTPDDLVQAALIMDYFT